MKGVVPRRVAYALGQGVKQEADVSRLGTVASDKREPPKAPTKDTKK